MTLLVALRATNGIVVASDSRGTFGDPSQTTAQNDAQKKLYVTSKYSCILVAGQGELGAAVMAETLKTIGPEDNVTVVMDKTRSMVRSKYNEWFPTFAFQPNMANQPMRPVLMLLIAGYDAPTEPKLFQLQSPLDFAPMLHNYGFALVGVAQYALYLLNRLYKPDSTVENLKALASYVITETASQDGKVGGPVQMATITSEEGTKLLDPPEVEKVIHTNLNRSNALKDSFFEEVK